MLSETASGREEPIVDSRVHLLVTEGKVKSSRVQGGERKLSHENSGFVRCGAERTQGLREDTGARSVSDSEGQAPGMPSGAAQRRLGIAQGRVRAPCERSSPFPSNKSCPAPDSGLWYCSHPTVGSPSTALEECHLLGRYGS